MYGRLASQQRAAKAALNPPAPKLFPVRKAPGAKSVPGFPSAMPGPPAPNATKEPKVAPVGPVAGSGGSLLPNLKVRIARLHPAEQARLKAGLEAQHAISPGRPIVGEIPTLENQAATQAAAQLRQAEQQPIEMARANATAFRAARPRNTTVRDDIQFARQAGEFFTGYQQLEHPGRDPLGAGLAVAGLLPFGKLGKVAEALRAGEEGAHAAEAAGAAARGGGLFGGAKKALLPRTPAETAQHLSEVAAEAKGQGWGRLLPKVPLLKPGEVSSETAGEAGAKVRSALANGNVGSLRNEQDVARSIERGKRAGAAMSAAAEKSGLAAHEAAMGHLGGELPHGDFQGFKGLSQPEMDQLASHIYEHPHFQPYEKISATQALLDAAKGKVPTKSDQALLERAFGKESAPGIVAAIKQSPRDVLINALNVPRSIMASFDLSAPFRQGLVAGVHSPGLFAKNFVPMFKAAGSEEGFQALTHEIQTRETFPLMEKAKLSLTDIGESAKAGTKLSKREEQFVSNYAERLPGIGRIVRGSDRAYVGFLNKTRADLFDNLLHDAAAQGHDLHDPKLLESIGKFVNSATGRGDLGKFADHAVSLNALMFSPRLVWSRVNFLNPAYYMSLSPYARREALKAAFRLASTMGVVLTAARMAGAKVNLDPRNADFAKIRIGNTRIDVSGGFQQYIRLIATLASGEIVSSTTGRLEHLSNSFAGQTRFDVASQFAENKLSPIPSMLVDLMKGKQFGGQPLTAKSELAQHMTPLLAQDAWDIFHQQPSAAPALVPDLFGVSVQTYGSQSSTPKVMGTLEKEAKQFGLGKVPTAVETDARYYAALNDATYAGQPSIDKAKAAAKLFDQRYGTNVEAVLPKLHTAGQAEALYTELRARLFPAYAKWQTAVDRLKAAHAAAQPLPAQPSPAPAPTQQAPPVHPATPPPPAQHSSYAPPTAPAMQETAYHPPAAQHPLVQQHAAIQQAQAAGPGVYRVKAASVLTNLAEGGNPASALSKLSALALQESNSSLTFKGSQPSFTVQSPNGPISFYIPKLSGPIGRAAKGAIALAGKYLGTPYVWGGESPKGFDCSGLLQYIYAQQGISIPRTTFDQYKVGKPVPKSQLKPGDAVFFAGSDGTMSNPGHVGIYIGHGRFIDAPHTGSVVRIDRLAGFPGYVGARRYG